AQAACGQIRSGRADAEPVHRLLGEPAFLADTDHPATGDLRQRGEPDVLAHRVLEDEALALAVFGDHDDAGPDCVAWPPDPDRASVPEHRAGASGTDSGENARESRPA